MAASLKEAQEALEEAQAAAKPDKKMVEELQAKVRTILSFTLLPKG